MPNPDKPTPQPDTNVLLASILERLAASQEALVANQPKDPVAQFEEWLKDNPQPVMPFPVYLHGIKLDADSLSAETLDLLPKLQEGRFFNRTIRVVRNHADGSWRIDWPWRDVSERMRILEYGKDFEAIVRRLTTDTPDKL